MTTDNRHKIKKPVVLLQVFIVFYFAENIRRDDWIRTSDPWHPMPVRYQAALHPEIGLQIYFFY